MAGRIPERQQRKLASQRTQTLGVDVSRVGLFGDLAKASSAFAKEARKEDLATQKAQANQTALRRGALVDSRSAIEIVNLNNDLDDIKRGSKDIRDYNEKASALLKDRVDGIEDDDLRATFSQDASKLFINKNAKFSKDFRGEELGEIETNLNSTKDRYAQAIVDLFSNKTEGAAQDIKGKIDTFKFLAGMFKDSSDKFKEALGDSSLTEFQQGSAVEFVRSAVDGLLETNPEDVETFLNSEGVSDILPPDEVRKLKKDASSLRQARQKDANFQRKVVQSATATQFFKDTAEGRAPSPTVLNFNVAEGTLTKEDAEKIRKYETSINKKEFLGDNPKTYSELLTSFGSITVEKDGKREFSEEASLEKLSLFRQQIMESMETGDLTKATGRSWLKLIEPKFNEGIKETLENIGNVNIVSEIWGGTTSLFTDIDDQDQLTLELQNTFMQEIDEAENELGRRITPLEMSGIVDNIKENFTFKKNVSRMQFTAGRTIELEGIRYKVVGHAEDGMPLLDTNLNAPLIDGSK